MNMEPGIKTQPSASVLYLEQEESEFITLEELISIFFKRIWVIAGLCLAVIICAVAYHKYLLEDSYSSVASISLASDGASFENSPNLSRELVQSEIQIIKSELIAKMVVEQLELYKEAKWVTPLTLEEAAPNSRAERLLFDAAVQNVLKSVDVEAFGRSFVIEIKGYANDPDEAARVANAVSNAYLGWRSANFSEDTDAATSVKQVRIEELAAALQEKEAELAKLRSDSGILSGAGSSIAEQKIRQAELAFNDAKLAFEERDLDYKRAVAANGSWSRLLSSALVEDSTVLNQLRNQQIILARELKELSTQYGSRHPDVIAKLAEISELEKSLEFEAQSIVEGLRARRDAARIRMETAQNNLSRAEAALRSSSADVVKISSVEREIDRITKEYDRYVKELSEATEDQEVFEDSATLLSEAMPPLYSNKPSLLMFLVLGTVLGGAAGIGGAVVLEAFDDKFYGASSVWSKLKKRAVSSVPDIKISDLKLLPQENMRNIASYAVAKPMSAFAESLRMVLSMIVENRLNQDSHVISVTSSVPNEGKSTLSLGLARIASISGHRVLLIDCDIRRRMTATISGVTVAEGILHAVLGERNWKDVTYRDTISNLDIIPAMPYNDENGEPIHNLDTKKLEELIEEMREHYDLILMDGPPVLAMADALGLARLADTNLMVIRSRFSQEKVVQTAIRQINTATGTDNVAIVLNRVLKGKLGRVSYDDSLYYGYAEKNYYQE